VDDGAVFGAGFKGDPVRQEAHEDDSPTAVVVEDQLRAIRVDLIDPLPPVEHTDVAGVTGDLDQHLIFVHAGGVLDDVGTGFCQGQRNVTLAVGRHSQAVHGVPADGPDQGHRDDIPGETQ
jgi:hypothetical protein